MDAEDSRARFRRGRRGRRSGTRPSHRGSGRAVGRRSRGQAQRVERGFGRRFRAVGRDEAAGGIGERARIGCVGGCARVGRVRGCARIRSGLRSSAGLLAGRRLTGGGSLGVGSLGSGPTSGPGPSSSPCSGGVAEESGGLPGSCADAAGACRATNDVITAHARAQAASRHTDRRIRRIDFTLPVIVDPGDGRRLVGILVEAAPARAERFCAA